ncbi:hypothetical protein ACGFX2_02275 [Streptomyces goshikiensis]|uniref:hypothetical protein n=1 Tax=Streptomyces goshikiensis TaxID=1942 RepID=UPI0037144CA7
MPSTARFRRAVTALFLSTALLAGATACGSGGSGRNQSGDVSAAAVTAAEAGAVAPLAVDPALANPGLVNPALVNPALDPAAAEPSPSTSAEKQKFAKTRFVANAGLAAGATYQWIVKPYREGKFKKGAKGRTFALIKAGLAGAFAYNRLKAAVDNAKGDPLLSKAVAPLTAGIESLKGLGTKLRKGNANDADLSSLQNVITGVKSAGQSAGAPVTEKVPSLSQLGG